MSIAVRKLRLTVTLHGRRAGAQRKSLSRVGFADRVLRRGAPRTVAEARVERPATVGRSGGSAQRFASRLLRKADPSDDPPRSLWTRVAGWLPQEERRRPPDAGDVAGREELRRALLQYASAVSARGLDSASEQATALSGWMVDHAYALPGGVRYVYTRDGGKIDLIHFFELVAWGQEWDQRWADELGTVAGRMTEWVIGNDLADAAWARAGLVPDLVVRAVQDAEHTMLSTAGSALRWAADLLPERGEDVVAEGAANLAGWTNELVQLIHGSSSGRPLGGNEDLKSNAAGAEFSRRWLDDSGSLAEQVIRYLEHRFGPIVDPGAGSSEGRAGTEGPLRAALDRDSEEGGEPIEELVRGLERRRIDGSALRRPGPGQSLEYGVRSRLEEALGAPLDDLRVHTGAMTEAVVRGLHAEAFALGHHVFLGGGHDPDSAEGLGVLVHEATHVVQAREGRLHGPDTAARTEALEAEAYARERAFTGARGGSDGPSMVYRRGATERPPETVEATGHQPPRRGPAEPKAPTEHAPPAPLHPEAGPVLRKEKARDAEDSQAVEVMRAWRIDGSPAEFLDECTERILELMQDEIEIESERRETLAWNYGRPMM